MRPLIVLTYMLLGAWTGALVSGDSDMYEHAGGFSPLWRTAGTLAMPFGDTGWRWMVFPACVLLCAALLVVLAGHGRRWVVAAGMLSIVPALVAGTLNGLLNAVHDGDPFDAQGTAVIVIIGWLALAVPVMAVHAIRRE